MKKRILASVLSLVFILGFALSPILAHADSILQFHHNIVTDTNMQFLDPNTLERNSLLNDTLSRVFPKNTKVKAELINVGVCKVHGLNKPSESRNLPHSGSLNEFNNSFSGYKEDLSSKFEEFETGCRLDLSNATPIYIATDSGNNSNDAIATSTYCFQSVDPNYNFGYLTATLHYNANVDPNKVDDGFTMTYYVSNYLFMPAHSVLAIHDAGNVFFSTNEKDLVSTFADTQYNPLSQLPDIAETIVSKALNKDKIKDDILSGTATYDYNVIDSMLFAGEKKYVEGLGDVTVKDDDPNSEFELYFKPAGVQFLYAEATVGVDDTQSGLFLAGMDQRDLQVLSSGTKAQQNVALGLYINLSQWCKDLGRVDIANSAFLGFGDSSATTSGLPQSVRADLADKLGKLLGEVLMCAAEDTNLGSEEFDDALGKYITALEKDYKDGFWYNLVKTNKKNISDNYKHQTFTDKYKEDLKDTDFTDPCKAMSRVINLWLQEETDSSGNFKYTGHAIKYNNKIVALNKVDPYAKDRSDPQSISVNDIWNDELTPYQKNILQLTFLKRKEQLGRQDIKVQLPPFIKAPGYSYVRQHAEQFAENNLGIEKDIHDSLQNVDDSLLDTQNVLNVVRSCSDLCKYIVGIMLYGKGSEDGGSYNIYNIYQPLMDSFVKGDRYIYEDVNIDYFPISVPSELPIFEDKQNKDNGIDYYDILFTSDYTGTFATFLYNVSYGFDVAAFGESSKSQKIDIDSIKEYFKQGDQAGNKPQGMSGLEGGLGDIDTTKLMNENLFGKNDMSADCKNMLRSIIQLADLCKFLGIANTDSGVFNYTAGIWTKTIDEYLEIYKTYETQFDAIKLNPNFFRISDTGEAGIDEPLGLFFNLDKQVMSDQWNQGFAASALYVPLHTNLYDVESVEQYMDKEYLQDFYYKYAFYRKALYINTDSSAVVNKFVSGKMSSSRKIATLNDLLNYRRDIILYVDDNFYNAKDISSVSSKLDYTAIRNGASQEQGDADQNVLEKAADNIGDAFSNALQLSPDQILKTGGNKYYSETLAKNVTKFGETKDKLSISERVNNSYILGEDRILGSKATEVEGDNNREKTESIFEEYEYSVEIPYGIVSAVYRSPELYNKMINCISGNSDIIFESSSAIGNTPGATPKEWRAIYNYYMLANLEDQMLNDSASSLDIYAPIFCDIFGNILTESGLVIIPAAANATLCGDAHTPYTIGFNEYYNNGKRIPINVYNDEVYSWLIGYTYDRANWSAVEISNGMSAKKEKGGGYFVIDPSGYLTLRTTQLSSRSGAAVIQWDMINKNSKVVKDLFYDDAYYTKAKGIFNDTTVNTVVETMRGAPIEYIDYAYEGIDASRELSPVGILMAAKLEEMSDSIIVGINGSVTNGNAAFTMPNLAFMSGIEYIVLYVFKIVFAVLLFAFAVNLYLDAVGHSLGIKSALKFIITCLLVLASITIIPKLISYSYDRANRDLLSNESGMIMMLNYVKDFDGAEVGVQSIRTPETSTKLYVKLDDIKMPWWSYLNNVLFNTTMKTVSQMYDDALKEHPMALEENVVRKADGLYMDTNDILDSTTIVYYPKRKVLMNLNYTTSVESQKTRGNNSITDDTFNTTDAEGNAVTKDLKYDYNKSTAGTSLSADNSVASYSFPYYVFLEKLTNDINEYNISQDVEAYQWSVGANGHIMTYEIAAPYLSSKQFLDTGYDILGLNSLLGTGVDTTTFTDNVFSKEDIDKMKLSAWFPTDAELKAGHISDKVNEVYDYARRWVAKNRYVLGNIPDEIFIKVLALQCAIKYNQVFGIPNANGIELIDLDTRDMIRFVVASSDRVYKDFSMSFARFVYETSGGLGVILTAFYILVLWFTSFLKPALMIVILGLLIVNAVFRKLLFRKESKCIEGFLIGCACLIGCNYLYALMLKITLNIAAAGFGAFVSLIFAILVQVAYVIALIFILKIEIKDWKNSGFNEFITIGSSIGQKFNTIREHIVDKVAQRHNRAFKETASSRRHRSANYDMDTLDAMLERDNERLDNAMNTA